MLNLIYTTEPLFLVAVSALCGALIYGGLSSLIDRWRESRTLERTKEERFYRDALAVAIREAQSSEANLRG